MSFSRATPSQELEHALDYAAARADPGGLRRQRRPVDASMYPAAYAERDGRGLHQPTTTPAPRSRTTAYHVWVAAPGEGVITTYPWGSFAAAWGTSFSTPMVAGAAAMLVGIDGSATPDQVAAAIANAQYLSPELGQRPARPLPGGEAARRNLWPDAAGERRARHVRGPPGWTGPPNRMTVTPDRREPSGPVLLSLPPHARVGRPSPQPVKRREGGLARPRPPAQADGPAAGPSSDAHRP